AHRSQGSTLLEGRHPHPSVSHPSSVLGLWDVPASAPFKTSPREHQVTLGRDWQEADLHEGPAPTHGSGRHQKARGPHHPAQEAEEAASQECPHHGLDGASALLSAQASGQGSASLGGTCRPLSGPCLHNNPYLSPVILGVDSQTVIQEPAMSVSPGGTVTLTCAFSSGSVTTSNYPSWFQQTPGQPPRQLIYETKSRPTGIPSRFSGNKATLTITGAQAEDEADYFCALEKSSANATVM
uniref:Ig-like domain-containing protein n=1 Tax=Sus scrofa TaxID=9823 RepID=A0A4X1UZS7_PIG